MTQYPGKLVNGAQYAIEQPIRYVSDPRTGAQTIRTFKGQYQALIGLVAGLQLAGWATDLNSPNNGQSWVLTATIGLSWANTAILDNPVDVWEITSNKIEKDFLNTQNALVASLTAGDIRLLQSFLENPQYPAPATLTDAQGDSLSGNGMIAYGLILDGVKSDTIYAPVLKHTQTTSNVYAVQASFQNVGMIYSTNTMLALLPNTLSFSLPPDPAYGKTGFAYGWLKDYPNVIVSAFNKSQIVQEYEFGLWNTTMKNVPL